MPLWSAGDNAYGALGRSPDLGTAASHYEPAVLDESLWDGMEVVSVSARWRHTLIQVASKGDVTTDEIRAFGAIPETLSRRTWGFGWNYYGQLGGSSGELEDIGQTPYQLPRTLFPRAYWGNEVASSNNKVRYNVLAGGERETHTVELPHGLYDAERFVSEVMAMSLANGHGGAWLESRLEGDYNVLSVVQGGYQLDLTGMDGPREALGFNPIKVPPDSTGTLGEASTALANNRIVFTALLSGGAWETRTLTFPNGTYQAVNDLNVVVKAELTALGLSPFAFFFGITHSTGVLHLDIFSAGIEVDLSQSTIIPALGFTATGVVPSSRDWWQTVTTVRTFAASVPSSLIRSSAEATGDIAGDMVHAVSVGRAHTLVQTYSAALGKRVWAMGWNFYGQLGSHINAGVDAPNRAPALINVSSAFYDAAEIHAGGDHSAVLDSMGALWLFGRNHAGQLGSVGGGWRYLPAQMDPVPFFPSPFTVFLGFEHTLVHGGGRVWGVGSNAQGQLGAASSTSESASPVELTASGVTSWGYVCAGRYHTVLLDSTGTGVWSSGVNTFGQTGAYPVFVGDALEALQYSLNQVPLGWMGDATVSSITCGSDHTLAMVANGTLVSWGLNSRGQLMDDRNIDLANPNPIPATVDPALFVEGPDSTSPQRLLRVWGGGRVTYSRTLRLTCDEGSFSADGFQPCYACPAGNYSNAPASTACLPCGVAEYTGLPQQTACTSCPQGTFNDQQGQSVCFDCPSSAPRSPPGSSSVSNCTDFCHVGTYGVFGAPPCLPCLEGEYAPLNASSSCSPCPVGTYQGGVGASVCIACSPGNSTNTTGATNESQCLAVCLPGAFGDGGLAPCFPCDSGYYAGVERSHECLPCPRDLYAENTSSVECLECPAGTGNAGLKSSNASDCLPVCPVGQFSGNAGIEPCSVCQNGTFSSAVRQEECTLCAAGTTSGEAATVCFDCLAGTSARSGDPNCTVCEVGSFQNLDGQEACTLCPNGQYANTTGATACTPCPGDLNTQLPGADSEDLCQPLCSAGTFSDTGLKPSLGVSCTNCSAGTRSNVLVGATSCVNCTAGTSSPEGSGTCDDCSAGYISGDVAEFCVACSAGTSSGTAASVCVDCSAGTFTETDGQLCEDCGRGKFQPSDGQSFCHLCTVGYYLAQTGSTVNCTECDAGRNAPTEGMSACTECYSGTYSWDGASYCAACDVGFFSAMNASIMCQRCPQGSYANFTGGSSCIPCEAGYDTKGEMGATACTECQVGTYSPGGQGLCSSCPLGTSTAGNGSESQSYCWSICTAGQYGDLGLAPDFGQDCALCSPGTYTEISWATACVNCAEGTSSNVNGTTLCGDCAAGLFSAEGSAECSPCDYGEYSEGGAANCTECDAGSFTSSQGQSTCQQCALGEIANRTGLSACEQCDSGTYAGMLGMTYCEICQAGNYSGVGQSECQVCPIGTYQDQAQSDGCISCPDFTSTGGAGSTSASLCEAFCPPGTYGEENGIPTVASPCQPCDPGLHAPFYQTVSCAPCERGSVSPSSGATYCNICPRNTYANATGMTACTACLEVDLGGGASAATYTIADGTASESECKTFSPDVCEQSPRFFPVYPVYASGSNTYGQVHIGTIYYDADNEPYTIPTLLTCDLFAKAEVYNYSGGGSHTLLLTARPTGLDSSLNLTFDRALWAFGLNQHGQLGASTGACSFSSNPTPELVPTLLFSTRTLGNVASAALSNNKFSYYVWNNTLAAKVLYTVTLPDGAYSPALAAQVASSLATSQFGQPQNLFTIRYDPTTQVSVMGLSLSGLQVDFGQPDSAFTAFGFSSGALLPENGTVNEVSREATNDYFVYRVWCTPDPCSTGGCEGLGEQVPDCGGYRDVKVVLARGIYSLEQLNDAVADVTESNGDGVSALTFRIADSHVQLTFTSPLMQAVFSKGGSVGSLLGFDRDVPEGGPAYYRENPLSSISYFVTATNRRGNLNGEGSGAPASVFEPVEFDSTDVSGMQVETAVAGGDHTVVQAWDRNQTGLSRVFAFGSNKYGQLGTATGAGTDDAHQVPLLVSKFDEFQSGLRAREIVTGGGHTLVLATDGTLWAFGHNKYGQLGVEMNSGTDTPVTEPQNVNFTKVTGNTLEVVSSFSAGETHSAVLTINSETGRRQLWTFGSNAYGQLGRSSATYGRCIYSGAETDCATVLAATLDSTLIVPVPNPTPGAIELGDVTGSFSRLSTFVAGGYHTMLMADDGMLWCVGHNRYGQCGHDFGVTGRLGTWHVGSLSPIVVGTKSILALDPPSAACCAPGCVSGGCGTCAGTCDAGWWQPADGSTCTRCPMERMEVLSMEAGKWHTVVKTNGNRLWAFGQNGQGELMITNQNLELSNPNQKPEMILDTTFGDGNQLVSGFHVGSRHSMVQTYRPLCGVGNHSVDRRSPCEGCEPGGFNVEIGRLTIPTRSPDQSSVHPYSQVNPIVPTGTDVLLGCSQCPGGQYSPETNSTACQVCGIGVYSFDGASTCHECAIGTYNDAPGKGNCTLCPAGYTTFGLGQTICDSCLAGTFSPTAGSTFCGICQVGSYSPADNATFCTQCTPSGYQDQIRQTSCKICPNDQRTPRFGSSSVIECTSLCKWGTVGQLLGDTGLGGGTCTSCEPGQRSNQTTISDGSGATNCIDCLPGTYSETEGSIYVRGVIGQYCWGCVAGSINQVSKATSCYFCPEGQDTLGLEGQTFCTGCRPGSYAASEGTGLCADCIIGTNAPGLNATACLDCPAGYSSKEGHPLCEPCGPGYESPTGGDFASGVAKPCVACSPGFFAENNATVTCSPCQPGHFSSGAAELCDECPAGTFSNAAVATHCDPCVAGTFASVAGSSICDPCVEGTFSGAQQQTCDPCAAGEYGPTPGLTGCEGCSAGTFTTGGASFCGDCRAGNFSGDRATGCDNCLAGSISANDGASTCTDCLAGTITASDGLSVCAPCNAGQYSGSDGLTLCTDCLVGSISAIAGQSSCDICAVGKYVDTPGQSLCIDCSSGFSTKGQNPNTDGRGADLQEYHDEASDCLALCAAGSSNIWGVEVCTSCLGGTYATGTGNTFCDPCIAGTYSGGSAAECTQCDPGQSSGPQASSCDHCGQGDFQDLAGQSSCLPCGISTYSNAGMATECTLCTIKIILLVAGSESANDLLYFKDCRAACDGETVPAGADELGYFDTTCCDAVAMTSVAIGTPADADGRNAFTDADELTSLLNAAAISKGVTGNLFQVTHDKPGWSRGDPSRRYLTVEILQGGFQVILGETPTTDKTSLDSGGVGRLVQGSDDSSRYYGPLTCPCDSSLCAGTCGLSCDTSTACSASPTDVGNFGLWRQIGTPMGFTGSRVIPPNGITACSSGTISSGGVCPSAFNASGDVPPSVLVTISTGSTAKVQCEEFCDLGTYHPTGKTDPVTGSCRNCYGGNFSSITAATECSQCAPGTFTTPFDSLNIQCTSCNVGTFSVNNGSTGCDTCDSGTFNPFVGASTCLPCVPGTYSGNSSYIVVNNESYQLSPVVHPDACAECPQGTYSWSGATWCSECLPGQYAHATGMAECTSCEPGRYSTANRTIQCSTCGPGTRSELESASLGCVPCLPGTFSQGSVSACTICSSGTFSVSGASECSPCPNGTFSGMDGASFCEGCDPGTFSIGTQSVCTDCPAGRFQWSNATSFCMDCSPGTESTYDGSVMCAFCNHGTYSGYGYSSCTLCPENHNTTGIGKTNISDCVPHCLTGFSGYNGVEPCTICIPGQYGPGNSTFCSPATVELAFWDGDESISENTSYPINGTCVPGTCVLCSPGSFQDETGSSACDECPLDTYTDYFGGDNCTKCAPGEQTFAKGADRADLCIGFCPPGSSSASGQKPCDLCEKGTSSSVLSTVSPCPPCEFGTYMDFTGATACKSCPAGEGTSEQGATTRNNCSGVAVKQLNDPGCNLVTGQYQGDEGSLTGLDIINPGSGYVNGHILVEETPGVGLIARFTTSPRTTIGGGSLQAVIVDEGDEGQGYTSGGLVTIVYTDPLTAGPSAKPMGFTVSAVRRLPFVSFSSTPQRYMSGCTSGIVVAGMGGGGGFVATYRAEDNGTVNAVCVGSMGMEGSCQESLELHGTDVMAKPALLVRQTKIVGVQVKQGSVFRGCALGLGVTCGPMSAAGEGSLFGEFEGCYTPRDVSINGGSIATVAVTNGGVGWLGPASVWPQSTSCRCGTGIHDLFLGGSTGGGYPVSSSGFLTVVDQGAGVGTGFSGSFVTDDSGTVSVLTVAEGGTGYASSGVTIAACPTGTQWSSLCRAGAGGCRFDGDLITLQEQYPALAELPRDVADGCFQFTPAAVMYSLGKAGGGAEAQGNFDECLEVVLEEEGCRCGSGLANVTLNSTDKGEGYLAGPLLAYQELVGECLCPTGEANETANTSGIDCEVWEATQRPDYCELAGFGFSANVSVLPDGSIDSFSIGSWGTGYNASFTRLVPGFPGKVRCSSVWEEPKDGCPQDGTVTQVTVAVSGPTTDVPINMENGTLTVTACDPPCSGEGLNGTCSSDGSGQVSLVITNHGTNYTASSPPSVSCDFDGFEVGGSINAGGHTITAVVGSGGAFSFVLGQGSGVVGSHDDCLAIDWADGKATVAAGPLDQLLGRLFPETYGTNVTEFYSQQGVVLDAATIGNGHMTWFMLQASGTESLTLRNARCELRSGANVGTTAVGWYVFGELACFGEADIWGLYSAKLELVFLEVSNSPPGTVNSDVSLTQLHMALFSVGRGAEASPSTGWLPFVTGGIAMFGGTPSDSWTASLSLGSASHPMDERIVHAASLQMTYSKCAFCGVPLDGWAGGGNPFPGKGVVTAGSIEMDRGFQVMIKGVGLKSGAGGYTLLGTETFLSKVRDGSADIALIMRIDVEGCRWPGTGDMGWEMLIKDTLVVRPLDTITQVGDLRLNGFGVASHPPATANAMVTVKLSENPPFSMEAVFALNGVTLGNDAIEAVITGSTSDWAQPFYSQWLAIGASTITINAASYVSGRSATNNDGLIVVSMSSQGSGMASFSPDPYAVDSISTSTQAVVSVPVFVRGSAGEQFPDLNVEVDISIGSSAIDPASVMRTILQSKLQLTADEAMCSSVGGQDLLFNTATLRVIYATWDAGVYELPSLDRRYRNCIASNGTVPAGTPCRFPFEYAGQVYTECTTDDWTSHWCSTTEQYEGLWGECTCDQLRRGVSWEAPVVINPSGPLTQVAGSPLGTFLSAYNGYNASASAYFPLFDTTAPNELQLAVEFTPEDLAECGAAAGSANLKDAVVGQAPAGDCEALGYVTARDEAGNEVCQAPDVPAGVPLNEYLVYASTQILQGVGGDPGPASRSSQAEPDVKQACIDAGLRKEIALCAEERVTGQVHANCFWTDTSRAKLGSENRFRQCAACSGGSCTTSFPPMRAWRIQV